MSSTLRLKQTIPLPPHPQGDYDHGDVDLTTGRVFVANTAAGSVEVLDGERLQHLATISGCPEASGVLCVQSLGLVLAAARGAGKLLVIDSVTALVGQEIAVAPRPNGLAWDAESDGLLVADVQENLAQLVDLRAGCVIATCALPGRPRWCLSRPGDFSFLINIREPACVVVISASTFTPTRTYAISASGPHGLALSEDGSRAWVACDEGYVVALDLATGQELARTPIAGLPDVVWHNHRLNRLYVSIARPGVLQVVNTLSMTVEQELGTEPGAHTSAYDAQRQRLYVFLPSCQAVVYEESEM
jgi:DNA-binding beta-propeller fold protein YncE